MFITVIAKCRRNYFKMFVFVVLFVPGYVTLSMSNVFCCHLAYKVPLENLNYVGQILLRHNNIFFPWASSTLPITNKVSPNLLIVCSGDR
jgi:hypothetical protein